LNEIQAAAYLASKAIKALFLCLDAENVKNKQTFTTIYVDSMLI